jgi:hypothetical protein
MCRNIKRLHNFDTPASEGEIRAAALQFVRKISGFTTPSAVNRETFNRAVNEVAKASSTLLGSLVSKAPRRSSQMGVHSESGITQVSEK